jgi:trimeric autotransporter adhesin
MKRSLTAIAVAIVAFFVVAGCNDYGNTFQNNTGAAVTSVSPSTISAGHGDFTLTLNGSGFVATTYVTWNGKKLVTTPVEDTNTPPDVLWLTAVVPAALVAKSGTATIITQSPFSGAGNNGLSNPVNFIITPPPNPVPTIMSLSPNNLPACGAGCGGGTFTLTVTGTNFIAPTGTGATATPGSTVSWNDVTQNTFTPAAANVTTTQITVQVPNALLATAGNVGVSVSNPPAASNGGGGGASNTATFAICSNATPCPPTSPASASSTAAAAEETPAVSADARYVAFAAIANGHSQILLRDTCEGAAPGCVTRTSTLSVASDGVTAANDDSHGPAMSADGRYVAFSSAATNLATGVPSGRQIYLRDTCIGAASSCAPSTQWISTDTEGALVGTESILPSVSATGRFVAFVAIMPSHSANQAETQAKSATPSVNSGYRQVFVRDTCLGATDCTPKTTRISLQPGDGTGTTKPAGPALSGNAKQVAATGADSSTLFTHSVPVDDQIFLAITKGQR